MTDLLGQLSPEHRLLLWSVRKCPETGRAERIESVIRKGIDWSYLVETSARHGLLPLLHKWLESNPITGVPTEVFDRVRDLFRKNLLWNLGRTRELLRLLDLFQAESIQAVPFKGPILAQLVYGDASLRQYVDLDIFVRPEDVRRARELLVGQGYRMDFSLTDRQEDAYLKSKDEYGFYHDAQRMLVEMHWRMVPRYYSISIDVEGMFTRLVRVPFSGREIMTFSPEDTLVLLCIHGSKHGWMRLAWVHDVVAILEANKRIDWETLLERTHRMGATPMVLLSFFLSQDLMGAELPQIVNQAIEEDSRTRRLATRIYERLFLAGPNQETSVEEDISLMLRTRERLTDKVRGCLDLAVTPTVGDWQSVQLPDFLYPLYYLLRPFRLAVKYGPRLIAHR